MFEEFLDFETFSKRFGTSPLGRVFTEAGIAVDLLPPWEKEQLIHLLYGKWPHNPNQDTLASGIKRAFQMNFYEKLYGKPASADVQARNEKAKENLLLSDEPRKQEEVKVKREKQEKKKVNTEENKPEQVQNTEVTPAAQATPPAAPAPKKEKKPKSEFALKVASMNLEQVVAWAKELSVDQEKIEKFMKMSTGLAKMNISNLIKKKLDTK